MEYSPTGSSITGSNGIAVQRSSDACLMPTIVSLSASSRATRNVYSRDKLSSISSRERPVIQFTKRIGEHDHHLSCKRVVATLHQTIVLAIRHREMKHTKFIAELLEWVLSCSLSLNPVKRCRFVAGYFIDLI